MEAIPELELRGIRSLRGGYEALRGIGLSLRAGETLFAMGGAGSGKSVLLKTAAGLLLPEEGEVLYRGKSLARMSAREEAAFRKASGFVFQDAALWANQSLYDNLALPVRLHEPRWGKAEVDRAVRRAAELVGYDQELHVRPAELSSGERKLIGLARALVLDPELLLMDDPTSILDEAAAVRVQDIVESLKARGRSILIASAASGFASRCADSISVLLGGTLAASGSYAEAAAWTDPRVRAVTGRLKPRAEAAPAWAGGLAGAWVDALAEGSAVIEGGPAAGAKEDTGMSALGDIINDVGDGKDGS
jgi:phospholipid/cholesterol/gamma-HCH transport system ATP-binding protein